jgi:TolB protein
MTRFLQLRPLLAVLCLAALAPALEAQKEFKIDIYSNEVFLVPILVEPLTVREGAVSRDDIEMLETSLRNDLTYTNLFTVLLGAREGPWSNLTQDLDPQGAAEVPQAIVTASLEGKDGRLILHGRLEDYAAKKEIFESKYEVRPGMETWACHAFCDDITRYLTGEQGVARTRIAFVGRNSEESDIMLVDWDGKRTSRVTELSSIVVSPTWSPEGRRIAFMSYHTGVPTLVGVDLKESNLWTLSREEGLNSAPAWSPRGDRIAFTLSKDGNAEIYTARPTGQDLRRITVNQGIDTAPCWSPTGRNIAFTSDRSGRPQVYVMDHDGANVRRITLWGAWNDSPDWSPRGDRIVYAGYTKTGFDLFVVRPDGTGLRRLTDHPGDCENPRWAPDGRHIVFSRRVGDQRRLWVLDAETLRERSLTPSKTAAYNPAWSPTLEAKSEAARWAP